MSVERFLQGIAFRSFDDTSVMQHSFHSLGGNWEERS